MDQIEFLEKNVFKGLEKRNDGFENENVPFFSESDFETILERVEYFGIAIYSMEPWFNGELYDVITNENLKKKATDPKWYRKAFLTFKSRQPGLSYSATYKVSTKLLSR